MAEKAITASVEVLRSGYVGQGPEVDHFEADLQGFLNYDYICTTNSATSAESLAYYMLKKPAEYRIETPFSSSPLIINWAGLSEDDEVLACPVTCTATNWPILSNNLRLKWYDVNPNTLGPDFYDLRRKLSAKTKVISIVHWGGYPVDLEEIFKIQSECLSMFGHWPLVVEDCAHAFGSEFIGRKLGAYGNISTFSFQAIKHITSVDGGLLVCPDQDFYRRAKLLRWYGIDRECNKKDFRCEANIAEWGFKYHMNDLSAAIGRANLESFDYISTGFIRCRDYYMRELNDISTIQLIQPNDSRMKVNPWLFSILVESKNDFYKHMHAHGVSVSQVHERNDKHTCVANYLSALPNVDMICAKLICLPCGWWVSDEDLSFIVSIIKKGW